jgi:hypothetical protein
MCVKYHNVSDINDNYYRLFYVATFLAQERKEKLKTISISLTWNFTWNCLMLGSLSFRFNGLRGLYFFFRIHSRTRMLTLKRNVGEIFKANGETNTRNEQQRLTVFSSRKTEC